MANTPRFKVFNPDGEYVASCKHVEDAACLVAFYGKGAQIRDGHTFIAWTKGRGNGPDLLSTLKGLRKLLRLGADPIAALNEAISEVEGEAGE